MKGCAAIALLLSLVAAAHAQEAPSAPTTQASTRPALTREQASQQLVEYLNGEYAKRLKSPDWIERSLAIVSLTKLPGAKATDQLLGVIRSDPTPAVKIVAWQAILARAKWLDSVQYQSWMDSTSAMVKKDYFRGTTRVGLLRTMAISPPTRASKVLFVGIFSNTNALQSRDIAVLDALGDCLAAWQTPDLAAYLFNRFNNNNDAYRAEYVLHRAGIAMPWAGERMDIGSVPMWKLAIDNDLDVWNRTKPQWQPMKKQSPEAWKTLRAQLIPSPNLDEPIDSNSLEWRREMEMGRADTKPLDVAFVVDATGSMQHVLDFLKRDLGQIKTGLELASDHPRLGLTFYRDQGDMFVTRTIKLTDRLNTLDAALETMEAGGGGDRPEAVLEALADCLQNNPWLQKRDARRAIVLLTDAPPKPETQAKCVEIATACREKQVKLFVMKVKSNEDQSDLEALDEIATAAGTEPMWMPLPTGRYTFPYPLPPGASREAMGNCAIAAPPKDDLADRQLLQKLMTMAINPKFGDRVEPIADIVLALTAPAVSEKREAFGVAEAVGNAGNNGGGMEVNMEKPRDPQAR